MMRVYTASRLDNANIVNAFNLILHSRGFQMTYEWAKHGYIDNTDMDLKKSIALKELNGVINADVLVVLLPGGFGTHIEIGAALQCGIPIIIVGCDQSKPTPSFYYLDAIHMVDDERACIVLLEQMRATRCKSIS